MLDSKSSATESALVLICLESGLREGGLLRAEFFGKPLNAITTTIIGLSSAVSGEENSETASSK